MNAVQLLMVLMDAREVGSPMQSKVRRQQGGGDGIIWAGVIKDQSVGPFRVLNGLASSYVSYV